MPIVLRCAVRAILCFAVFLAMIPCNTLSTFVFVLLLLLLLQGAAGWPVSQVNAHHGHHEPHVSNMAQDSIIILCCSCSRWYTLEQLMLPFQPLTHQL
jgi:hypothetical protein